MFYALEHTNTDDCTFWVTEVLAVSTDQDQLETLALTLMEHFPDKDYWVREMKINGTLTPSEVTALLKDQGIINE